MLAGRGCAALSAGSAARELAEFVSDEFKIGTP
jgi:hypothetical protein